MSSNKIVLIIIGLIILIGVGYLALELTGDGADDNGKSLTEHAMPELHLAQMQLTGLTEEKAQMRMNMVMDNPAPMDIRIDSLHYIAYIEDNEVARTTYPDPLELEASDSATASLPLTIYYDRMQSLLDQWEAQGIDSGNYKLDVTVYADSKLIPDDSIDFEVDKRLPLIRTPDIEILELEVEDLGLSSTTLEVYAMVTNNNVFDMGFSNMYYTMTIEGNETMEGSKPGTVNIPAKSSEIIMIPVELDMKAMGKNMIELIKKGGDMQYDFTMRTELNTEQYALEDSEMRMNATGKIGDLAGVAKEHMEDED